MTTLQQSGTQNSSAKEVKPSVEEIDALFNRIYTRILLGVNDVFLRQGAATEYREGGKLLVANDWGIGEGGYLPDSHLIALIQRMREKSATPQSADGSFTTMFRSPSGRLQFRIDHCPQIKPLTLHIRVQPSTPYKLDNYLKSFPATKKSILSAKGLIVVCGEQGAGKTSLAASLVDYYGCSGDVDGKVRDRRHILQIGDPIEYDLSSDRYLCSTIECQLTGDEKDPVSQLEKLGPKILRSGMDAMLVGEIRDASTLRSCLEFSADDEPVITTVHAKSISDCIARILCVAERVMRPETARLILSACLHGIFYIKMGYVNGKAVPLIQYLPAQSTAVRKAIVDCMEKDLTTQIERFQVECQDESAITRRKAIEVGRAAGFSDVEVETLLGRLATQTSLQNRPI